MNSVNFNKSQINLKPSKIVAINRFGLSKYELKEIDLAMVVGGGWLKKAGNILADAGYFAVNVFVPIEGTKGIIDGIKKKNAAKAVLGFFDVVFTLAMDLTIVGGIVAKVAEKVAAKVAEEGAIKAAEIAEIATQKLVKDTIAKNILLDFPKSLDESSLVWDFIPRNTLRNAYLKELSEIETTVLEGSDLLDKVIFPEPFPWVHWVHPGEYESIL